MKRVLNSEIDYPGDGLYYHEGKRFTGVKYTLNEDAGWIEAEREYLDGHTTAEVPPNREGPRRTKKVNRGGVSTVVE
jgi:hypothetical protein